MIKKVFLYEGVPQFPDALAPGFRRTLGVTSPHFPHPIRRLRKAGADDRNTLLLQHMTLLQNH